MRNIIEITIQKFSESDFMIVEDLDNNYNKLSPRYKIILILEDMKKSIDEIKIIMSFEETSYYSAKSRINGAKK